MIQSSSSGYEDDLSADEPPKTYPTWTSLLSSILIYHYLLHVSTLRSKRTNELLILPLPLFPANPSHLSGHQPASQLLQSKFPPFCSFLHTFNPSAGPQNSQWPKKVPIIHLSPSWIAVTVQVFKLSSLIQATATASKLAVRATPAAKTGHSHLSGSPLCWLPTT